MLCLLHKIIPWLSKPTISIDIVFLRFVPCPISDNLKTQLMKICDYILSMVILYDFANVHKLYFVPKQVVSWIQT